MSNRRSLVRAATFAAVAALTVSLSSSAGAQPVPDHDYATPIFGLATAPDGGILVADAGAGMVELRKGTSSLVAELPGVTDIAPLGRRSLFAITGGGDAMLYRIGGGSATPVADLGAFEAAANPDGGEVDSNPFDVARLSGGTALVADAGANALLAASRTGHVGVVAVFPDELVSTDWVKAFAGCPDAPEDFAFVCGLPDMFPAQAVPTSVVVGPDGAYYVGELKGFPAGPGNSRIWRIAPGTRDADCATSSACSVVADGFTSIVDLSIGANGMVHVTEIDEDGFLAVEFGGGIGGTVSACSVGSWSCHVEAAGLPLPLATTVGKNGTVYAAILGLVPGAARVVPIT